MPSSAFYNPSVVSAVIISNNQQYRFYCNPYAELARVELPTGGAYEYEWRGAVRPPSVRSVDDLFIYRRVIERRVYSDSGTTPVRKTLFSIPTLGSSDTTTVVTHQDASGTSLAGESHTYYHSPLVLPPPLPFQGSGWDEGKEYQTQERDATDTVLKQRNHTWVGDLTPYPNPRITRTETTLEPTTANLVATQIFGYDRYNNKTSIAEYDYRPAGSPLGYAIRRTQIDYLTTNTIGTTTYSYDTINPDTTNPNINLTYHLRNLPRRAHVFKINSGTGAETVVSDTQFEYDQTDLRPRTNISGWEATYLSLIPRGNVTRTSRWLNSPAPETWLNTDVQYDIAGHVVKTIDPNTNIIEFDFSDNFGKPDGEARTPSIPPPSELAGQTSFAFPTKITKTVTPTFKPTTYAQYDYYIGQFVDTEDWNGAVTSMDYTDKLERPVSAVRGANLPAPYRNQSAFIYDDPGHSITTKTDLNASSDGLLQTQMLYDGLGRTIETRKYENATDYISTVQTYDALGRAATTGNPCRPQTSGGCASTDPTYGWTTANYDALSRVVAVQSFDASGASTGTVQTAYSGNQSLGTDQAGKQRLSKTNALGQLTDVWEITLVDTATTPVSFGSQNLTGYWTHYDYDALNNLTQVTQPGGAAGTQKRFFVYDSLKRLLSVTNPESCFLPTCNQPVDCGARTAGDGGTCYLYDNNGNLTQKVDARGIVTTYEYDALNRLTFKRYPNNDAPSNATPDVVYFYDGATTQPTSVGPYTINPRGFTFDVGIGRATASLLVKGSTIYPFAGLLSYDPLGRVKKNGQRIEGVDFSVGYGYNLADNIRQILYLSGKSVTYTYTAADWVQAVSNEIGNAYLYGTKYAPHGAMTDATYGHSLVYSANYNSRLQPTRIWVKTADTTPSSKMDLLYNYTATAITGINDCLQGNSGNNGNVYQVLDQTGTPNKPYDFCYDPLNRLRIAKGLRPGTPATWTHSYVYDRYGNLSDSGDAESTARRQIPIDKATNMVARRV